MGAAQENRSKLSKTLLLKRFLVVGQLTNNKALMTTGNSMLPLCCPVYGDTRLRMKKIDTLSHNHLLNAWVRQMSEMQCIVMACGTSLEACWCYAPSKDRGMTCMTM